MWSYFSAELQSAFSTALVHWACEREDLSSRLVARMASGLDLLKIELGVIVYFILFYFILFIFLDELKTGR